MIKRQLLMIPDPNNIELSLRLAAEYEAGFEYNDFFIPSLLDDEDALKKKISFYKNLNRERTKDTLHGAFLDICVNSQDEKIAKISRLRMRQSLETASMLGCSGVIFHTNIIPGFENDFYLENWLDCHTEFYRGLLNEYKGINIYVENMFDLSPKMLLRLAENMKDCANFGACLDIAHAHLSKVPAGEWIKELAPYIKHIHVNDNHGIKDEHLAISKGKINWTECLGLLDEYKIDASMLIEVNKGEDFEYSAKYLRSLYDEAD